MNCPIESRRPEMLVALTAGELDAAESGSLEQHLAGCPACRKVAAGHAEVWKALDVFQGAPISLDFDRRLYQRIDQEVETSWWARAMRPFRNLPLRQAVPLTATAGLLLMVGVLLQHPRQIAPVAPHRIVRANQVERTLDDLELLRQFNSAGSAESTPTDAM